MPKKIKEKVRKNLAMAQLSKREVAKAKPKLSAHALKDVGCATIFSQDAFVMLLPPMKATRGVSPNFDHFFLCNQHRSFAF